MMTWIAFFARRWTGYTHQWRTCDPRYSSFLMASADSPGDKVAANARGWRTFRVRSSVDAPTFNETVCPASPEGGHKSTCERCGLCSGSRRNETRRDVVIAV